MSLTRVQLRGTRDHILFPPNLRHPPRASPAVTEANPAQPTTHNAGEIQTQPRVMTLWEQLSDQERTDCVGDQRKEKCNSQYCWEVKGHLREDIWLKRTLPLLDKLENENHSLIYGTGGHHLMRTFHIYLLSSTDDSATAWPTVLIAIRKRKIGSKIKQLFESHQHFQDLNRGFRIEVLGRTRFRFLAADEPPSGSSQQRHPNHSASSLCGTNVQVTTLPPAEGSMWKRATVGGVVCKPGTSEFFALTVAHCLSFDDVLADPEDSVSSEGSSLGEESEDDDITVPAKVNSDGSEISQPITGRGWLPDAICGAYIDTSLLRREGILPPSLEQSEYIGYIDLETRDFDDAAASEESAQYSKDLDWALIRIIVPKFLQINQLETPWNTCLYPSSIVRNSDALDCKAILAAGCSGIREVSFSGTVTSVKFPWSTTAQMLWTVEADLAEGDSGSWVLSTDGYSVYGMIVASLPTLGIAYVSRAQDIFEGIQSAWHNNCNIDDMLPKKIHVGIQMGQRPIKSMNLVGTAAKTSSSTKPATASKPHGSEELSPSRKLSLRGTSEQISQMAPQTPQISHIGPDTVPSPGIFPNAETGFLGSKSTTNTPDTSVSKKEPSNPVRVEVDATRDIMATAGVGFKLSLMLNAFTCEGASSSLEAHSLSSEVTLLALMLKQIGVILQRTNSVHTPEALSTADMIAHESSFVLEELEVMLDRVRARRRNISNVSHDTLKIIFESFFRKHRVAYLLASLEHFRLTLTVMLGILQLRELMASATQRDPTEEAAMRDEAVLAAQNSLVVRQLQMANLDKLFKVSEKEEREDIRSRGLQLIPRGFPGIWRRIDRILRPTSWSARDMINTTDWAVDELLEHWTDWREVRANIGGGMSKDEDRHSFIAQWRRRGRTGRTLRLIEQWQLDPDHRRRRLKFPTIGSDGEFRDSYSDEYSDVDDSPRSMSREIPRNPRPEEVKD